MNAVSVICSTGIRLINRVVKRSFWYQELFSASYNRQTPLELSWAKNSPRNFEYLALGSTAAFWGIDFNSVGANGINWAGQQQKMEFDYRLLKTCHSFLRSGGRVIFTICPFSSINSPETVLGTLKYLKMFQYPQLVLRKDLYQQALRIANNPLLLGKDALCAAFRVLLHKDRPRRLDERSQREDNDMSSDELKTDAERWMAGWKSEFGIANLDEPLTEQNEFGRHYKVFLMERMLSFCFDRGYEPIIVVLPVSKVLADQFSEKAYDNYISSYLNFFAHRVRLLNYFRHEAFRDSSLYFNSFFLNRKGRQLFTARLLSDIAI